MTVITASAAGGNWNQNGAWVGGVQPTAADDVLLTVTSGNITIPTATTALCRSIDCTGYTGTMTWASVTALLNIGDASGGAATFVAGMTVVPSTGQIRFLATTASTVYDFTTGGKTFSAIVVQVGASTTIRLADNLTTTGGLDITLLSGIFDTNGKAVVANGLVLTGAPARTLTLGASTLTLSGTTPWNATTITNLTVTANTATATCNSATNATFNGGGKDWNGLSLVFTNPADAVLTGANTGIANLTRTGAALDTALTFAAAQTVTGTLTLTGNSAANRLWVRSSVAGTSRTLTVGTTVTASRVDFEDITGAGAASWNLVGITDGSGDIGGNSGITLTPAADKYGKAAGNFSATATWALTSGGAAGAPYPLPQDNVFLDANSGAGTYTMNMMRHCKDLTCTGFTGTLTLGSSTTQRYIFGSLTLAAGMTFTATGNFTFAGRGSHTIDVAGKAFTATANRGVTIGRFNGTYTLLSNLNLVASAPTATINAALITVGGVTFAAAGFNVNTASVQLGVSTVNMGAGTWNLWGTGNEAIWQINAATALTASTSSIVVAGVSANARTFAGNGKTYNDLTYTVAGSTGGLDFTGANTFHDLNFSDVTNARTLRFTAATTQTITGNFNVFGTPGKLMTIDSITAANHTLVKTGGTPVVTDYLSISRSQAGGVWYAGANSTDAGNNTGWIFTDVPDASFFLMWI